MKTTVNYSMKPNCLKCKIYESNSLGDSASNHSNALFEESYANKHLFSYFEFYITFLVRMWDRILHHILS